MYFGLRENAMNMMNRHRREGYPRMSSMFKNSSRSIRPEIGLSNVVL